MEEEKPFKSLTEIWVDLQPKPFSRTGGSFTDSKTGTTKRMNTPAYRTWLKNASEHIAAHANYRTFTGEVSVKLKFSADGFSLSAAAVPPEDARRRRSGLRGDLDNYMKAVGDAMQRARLIVDDKQIVVAEASFEPPRRQV